MFYHFLHSENPLSLAALFLKKVNNVKFFSPSSVLLLTMVEGLTKRMQNEFSKLQGVEKDLEKHVTAYQQLTAQLTENKTVKEELDLLGEDSAVFKMIGPVLVKQELDESRSNVQKRIDYIQAEM